MPLTSGHKKTCQSVHNRERSEAWQVCYKYNRQI
jgi:hypothetical protein